jgi:hypothetical protein
LAAKYSKELRTDLKSRILSGTSIELLVIATAQSLTRKQRPGNEPCRYHNLLMRRAGLIRITQIPCSN